LQLRQAVFAARLEVVFQPLRDLVAFVQGWTDQVSSLWGSLALANSSALGEHENLRLPLWPMVRIPVVDVAGCSSELGVMAQSVDDPPALDDVLLEMVIQGVEKQTKVDKYCNGMELTEVVLPAVFSEEMPPPPLFFSL
jgi:hypothetical protein